MVDKDTLKIVNDALDAVKLMNREWQGLSDDEIENMWNTSYVNGCLNFEHRLFFAHAIERALKEKNNG